MDYTALPLPGGQKEEIHRILSDAAERAGGVNNDAIVRSLQELATDDADTQSCFSEIVIRVLEAALNSPNPEAALNRFSRFTQVAFNRRWLYQLLRDAPFLMRTVIFGFGASTYLSETLIRNPEYFYDITDRECDGDTEDRRDDVPRTCAIVVAFRFGGAETPDSSALQTARDAPYRIVRSA